ncbi:hypothetical protein CDCA_CDCA01G0200 [Cyanidium caldarium]|uniref:Magnesium transporter n=1 Tax=Cyanidium caldarium TaxID=2771 RepID=A0AAV9IPZ8_CYACA|nr:hypothetical protein CDCA_CDCA01G0200 [Cyanidium caldarium]
MDGTDDRLRSPRSQRPTAAGGEYSSGPAHATVPMFRWADTDGSSEDEFSLRDTSSSDEGEMALLEGDANVAETDAAGHESPWAEGAVAASLGSPRPPESVPAAAPAAERSMRRALSANDVARVAEATDRDALLESDGGAVGATDRHSIELGAAPWTRALHTPSASAWATPGAVHAAPPLTLPPWAMRVDDGAACTAPVSATADSFARPERASSSESLALALTLDDVGGRRSKSGFIPMLERTPTPPPPTSPLLRRMHSEGDLALAGGAAAESAVPETTGPLLKKPKRPLNALLCFLFDRLGNVQLTTVLSSEILLTARTLEEEERSAHLARAVEDASGAADTTNAATTSLPASTSPAAAAPNGARHPKRKQRKRQRLRLHGLVRARDIRYVHPSMRAKPVVMVRRHLFIMCFEHIRAIVLADRLFLFDPGNPRVQASARALEDRLAVAKLDASTYAPFELRALEALLIEVCAALERDLAAFEPRMMQLLIEITRKISDRRLESLMAMKQQLSNFVARARGVRHGLQDLLREDEDMARMYLTELRRHPAVDRSPAHHEEVEIVLESYLHVVDHLVSRADLLGAAIDDTEDTVGLQLDTMRNRLLRLGLMLTILTMAFAGGALVNRWFSMNLKLPVYQAVNGSERWFYGLTVTSCVLLVLTVAAFYGWARYAGLMKT